MSVSSLCLSLAFDKPIRDNTWFVNVCVNCNMSVFPKLKVCTTIDTDRRETWENIKIHIFQFAWRLSESFTLILTAMCHPSHQGLEFLITGVRVEIWFDYDETDTLMLIRAALSVHKLSHISFSIALHRPESRTIKVLPSSKCLTKQSPALTCSSPSRVSFSI